MLKVKTRWLSGCRRGGVRRDCSLLSAHAREQRFPASSAPDWLAAPLGTPPAAEPADKRDIPCLRQSSMSDAETHAISSAPTMEGCLLVSLSRMVMLGESKGVWADELSRSLNRRPRSSSNETLTVGCRPRSEHDCCSLATWSIISTTAPAACALIVEAERVGMSANWTYAPVPPRYSRTSHPQHERVNVRSITLELPCKPRTRVMLLLNENVNSTHTSTIRMKGDNEAYTSRYT